MINRLKRFLKREKEILYFVIYYRNEDNFFYIDYLNLKDVSEFYDRNFISTYNYLYKNNVTNVIEEQQNMMGFFDYNGLEFVWILNEKLNNVKSTNAILKMYDRKFYSKGAIKYYIPKRMQLKNKLDIFFRKYKLQYFFNEINTE